MYIVVPIQQGTHIIEYITFGVLLCVTHSDHLAIPTVINIIVVDFVFTFDFII